MELKKIEKVVYCEIKVNDNGETRYFRRAINNNYSEWEELLGESWEVGILDDATIRQLESFIKQI